MTKVLEVIISALMVIAEACYKAADTLSENKEEVILHCELFTEAFTQGVNKVYQAGYKTGQVYYNTLVPETENTLVLLGLKVPQGK